MGTPLRAPATWQDCAPCTLEPLPLIVAVSKVSEHIACEIVVAAGADCIGAAITPQQGQMTCSAASHLAVTPASLAKRESASQARFSEATPVPSNAEEYGEDVCNATGEALWTPTQSDGVKLEDSPPPTPWPPRRMSTRSAVEAIKRARAGCQVQVPAVSRSALWQRRKSSSTLRLFAEKAPASPAAMRWPRLGLGASESPLGRGASHYALHARTATAAAARDISQYSWNWPLSPLERRERFSMAAALLASPGLCVVGDWAASPSCDACLPSAAAPHSLAVRVVA